MNYNEQCRKKQCEYYIEWQFTVDDFEQPYDCTSCKLQGQSYDIDEIAEDCPYKDIDTARKEPTNEHRYD